MAEPASRRKAGYDDLFNIPANTTGQIIDGELIVSPRPSRGHALAQTALAGKLTPRYYFGDEGGPGGWIILVEPEVMQGEDLLVPDVAGWRQERFPFFEETNWISVFPDWACEVLSPGTIRTDRIKKVTIYALHGLKHLWLIDPQAKTLEVLRLETGRWVILGVFAEDDKARAEPFQEIEIDLSHLWLEGRLSRPRAANDATSGASEDE
jgi:Uma2 family endonuclease